MIRDVPPQLRQALHDRYVLERELGRGGMATVYLAQDLKHDRRVALKLLHPELATTLGPERFLREIHLTARLDHPHILPVFDSGAAGGLLWYTMPYVEGESLRDRLQREGQLPVEDAVRLAREVADALDCAHQQGVVHRDIKPENILLARGHARVADFGVARAVEAAGAGQLTETGLAVGTPAYMSPEQASGSPVDARSDLYALGCVLYEMLAGEPPFTGPTPQAVIARRFTEVARPLHTLRETVPPPVEEAVAKALAKIPADRFQTAADFVRALTAPVPTAPMQTPAGVTSGIPVPATAPITKPQASRRVPVAAVTLGLGFVIGLGVLFAWRRTHPGESGTTAHGKVLAVLPFENQGAAQDEYFADGVTDAVRGKLAAVPSLEVIARGSSAPYKKSSKTPQQIATELGARYLLTGTVRWQKGVGGTSRVLVSPELVEVVPGRAPRTRWDQPFDAALTDVFRVQADIASQVTTALDVALGTSEKALEAKPTTNPVAYDFYLRGNEYFNRGIAEPDLRVAERLYRNAVELDSAFALAFAQLSLADDGLYWFYYDRSKERLAKQKEAADQALRLQPDLAEGHLALGFYYYHGHLEYDHALAEFEAARKRQPSNGSVYSALAAVHRRQGKWSEARVEGKKSVELNPRSMNDLLEQGLTEMFMRAYAEAEPYFNRAIEVSPGEGVTYTSKHSLYVLWRGDTLSAARAIREGFAKASVEKVVPALYRWGAVGPFSLRLNRELFGPPTAQVPVEAFGSDTVGYFLYQAELRSTGQPPEPARAYLDSARAILEAQVSRHPDDPRFHARLGATDAMLGRGLEAIREGEKAAALRPVSQDALDGALNRLNLARILAQAGQTDAAVDQLAYLLSVPGLVSVPALRVDPTWAPLRGNPRFERLVRVQHE
jgi:TolB-like protein/tRNA A-37 threonylcarbamoyl transferase component Bud32/Flp pilus assembly protein TadD